MSLILNIDTIAGNAGISLAFEGKLLQQRVNGHSPDHAAWIHTAIQELMHDDNKTYQLSDIKAVAVVAGPGSYTGIRVGMSTAKGLCYALNIPLISLNTLTVMADATKAAVATSVLLCPMLDARRMEVFTAMYDTCLHEILQPCAIILNENSFSEWLNKHEIIFFGSGSNKWKKLVRHKHAIFKDIVYTQQDIALISYDKFTKKSFSGLAYTEPVYLKDFYTTIKNDG